MLIMHHLKAVSVSCNPNDILLNAKYEKEQVKVFFFSPDFLKLFLFDSIVNSHKKINKIHAHYPL